MSAVYATPAIRLQAANKPMRLDLERGMTVGDLSRPGQNAVQSKEAVQGASELGFGDMLGASISKAAELGHIAGDKSDAFARGTLDDLHGTMVSAKQAEISLKLVGAVRNKLLDAFHELWRISV